MDKQDIIRKMQEAGLKGPARGEFIFIHWDQIAMLIEHERSAAIKEALADQPAKHEPVAKDAEEWGGRLNEASWAAVEAWNTELMGPMPDAVFNNIKPVIRAAILKYAEGYTTTAARKPLTDKRLKVKIGSQYGGDLTGHWFYLQPADEFAEAALAKHTGIEAEHGIKENT